MESEKQKNRTNKIVIDSNTEKGQLVTLYVYSKYGNYTYHGEYLEMYIFDESLSCSSETKIISYRNYIVKNILKNKDENNNNKI